jgi:hypothetical protein
MLDDVAAVTHGPGPGPKEVTRALKRRKVSSHKVAQDVEQHCFVATQ